MFTQGKFMGYYWGVGAFLSKHPNGGIPGGFFVNGETNSIWVWDFLNKKWIDSNRVEGPLQGIVDDPATFEPNAKPGIKTTYLYLSNKPGNITFANFLNTGVPIEVSTETNAVIMLFWNGDYWETSVVPVFGDVSGKAEKDLSNVSENKAMSKVGIYNLEGSNQPFIALTYQLSDDIYHAIGVNSNGEPVAGTGTNGLEDYFGEKTLAYADLSNMSESKLIQKTFSEFSKRQYKTPILNWEKSKTCPYAEDISNFIIDVELTGNVLGTSDSPRYWGPVGIYKGSDKKAQVMLFETDEDGNYLDTFTSIAVNIPGDGFCYSLDQDVKASDGTSGKVSIVVNWSMWPHGNKDGMSPLRLSDEVLKEHSGKIAELKQTENTTDKIIPAYTEYANSINVFPWNGGNITSYHGKSGFTFSFTNSSPGSDRGVRTEGFNPDPNYRCIVDVNVKEITPDSNVYLYLFGTNGNVVLQSKKLSVGENKMDFDPAYYKIYQNQDWFYLVLSVNGTSPSITVDVESFICAKYPIGQAENLTETISELQSKNSVLEGEITNLKSSSDIVLTDPYGTKYVLCLTDADVFGTIPLYPQKLLYIGNSLLLGNGNFGMNATESTKDYAFIIDEYILAKGDGTYTPIKIKGGGFEESENYSDYSAWKNETLTPNLSEDIDLVIIQLGDNVNTETKRSALENNVSSLIRDIKSTAKRARIAWVYGWYVNEEVRTTIQDVCKAYGANYIEINDLNTQENRSKIGDVITKELSTQQSLVYTSYEELSTNQLKINFTIGGKDYTSTIEVTSYSDNAEAKTLTWEGYQTITADSGVASHPGDLGFEKIAQRILSQLKLD